MFDTHQERLKAFIDEVFKSQKACAEYLNMKPQALNSYLREGGSKLKSYRIINLLKQKGFNTEWYEHGIGDMIISNAVSGKTIRHLLAPVDMGIDVMANPFSETQFDIELSHDNIGFYSVCKVISTIPVGAYVIVEPNKDFVINAVALFEYNKKFICRRIVAIYDDSIDVSGDYPEYPMFKMLNDEYIFHGIVKIIIQQ